MRFTASVLTDIEFLFVFVFMDKRLITFRPHPLIDAGVRKILTNSGNTDILEKQMVAEILKRFVPFMEPENLLSRLQDPAAG
jgi:hypothetical protein